MFRLTLRAVVLLVLSLTLVACGTRPRQAVDPARLFEIRAVAVTANGGVPRGVISGVQRQVELAIDATSYAVPMPHAVMNIHIVGVNKVRGDGAGRAQTEVSVMLSDVESGQTVLARNYLVLAFSERGRVSDAAIVGAVAARLRSEFALVTPSIRPVRHDPRLSTRLKSSPDQVIVKEEKPLIIPLRTAPVLGADQDPLLNSKTKVEVKPEPAKVEPAMKVEPAVKVEEKKQPVAATPTENTLESGAKVKVVIKPKASTAAPADDEPCVETLDKKC
ncbi:MAG: putative lipoprotein [Rhizobium sp.]|nr:putative lipoprotein [Rhizobium sp.]